MNTRIANIELTWVDRGAIGRVVIVTPDLTMETSMPGKLGFESELRPFTTAIIVVANRNGQHIVSVSLIHKNSAMSRADLFMEVVATYRKHGWELKAALLQAATRDELLAKEPDLLKPIEIKDAALDALWFSRTSHNNRDAWELRLLAETQYALFETFEADETEEQREEMKLEMEAKLREYVGSS